MRAVTRIFASAIALAVMVVASAGCSAGIQNDGNYRFGDGVWESDREAVKGGAEAMERWLAEQGNIHLKRLTIEVDDDLNTLVSRFAYYYEGDPLEVARWFLAGGAIATGDVVYIYAGEEWRAAPDWEKSYVAAHELFHVAQYGFLFDDWWLAQQEDPDQPPAWLIEGGADYAAARALDAAGIRPYAEIRADTADRARGHPGALASITRPDGDHASGDAAPYAVGFLAVEALAASHGEGAMFDFWDALAEEPSWEAAFLRAFGSPAAEFVASFDSARGSALGALRWGVQGSVMDAAGRPVAGARIAACATEAFACRSTWTASDGTFSLALDPGEYDVTYRVATRGATEHGIFRQNGREIATIAISSEWVTGLEATVKAPL